MNDYDVIIAGAGAAGLITARELSKKGLKVCILEAQDRIGGRIHTLRDGKFSSAVELGAEFVHGNLPITIGLLNEAHIAFQPVKGNGWQINEHSKKQKINFGQHWSLFEEKLKELKKDCTLNDFLKNNFSQKKYSLLRNSVKRYAEGFDTADPKKASTMALRDEWLHEDESAQHRIKTGYDQLVDFLANEFKRNKGVIFFNAAAKKIHWEKNNVSILASEKKIYTAKKLVLAVSLGILQAKQKRKNSLQFSPGIPNQIKMFRKLGFGSVIKILIEFKTAFWRNEKTEKRLGKNLRQTGFIFSAEKIPTWWTQLPEKSALLTGWLGGKEAEKLGDESEENIFKISISSLSSIFQLSENEIKENISTWRIVNWNTDPYTLGSYSYATVASKEILKSIKPGIENTLFFCGEAFYEGKDMGTVEAALANGIQTAEIILNNL
jgi:monoamine oxidase